MSQELHSFARSLVLAEPEDLEELARIAEAARTLANAGDLPLLQSKTLLQISERVETCIAGDLSPEQALKAASRLVSAIVDTPTGDGPSDGASENAGEEPLAPEDGTWAEESSGPAPSCAPPTAAEEDDAVTVVVNEDAEIVAECLSETRSDLDEAELALLALEETPGDTTHVDNAFRHFHTIKGIAGFLQLTPITKLAHAAEALLSRVRDGELAFQPEHATLTLEAVDILRGLNDGLAESAASGTPTLIAPTGWSRIVDQLRTVAAAERAPTNAVPTSAVPTSPEPTGEASSAEARPVAMPPSPTEGAASDEAGPVDVHADSAAVSEAPADSSNAAPVKAAPTKNNAEHRVETFVRVRTDRLDGLLDSVGELVISHAMLADDPTLSATMNPELARRISHAGKIVRELQDLSMSLRMVPLRGMFQKMGRVVRDVAQKRGKRVKLVTAGEDTELDRSLVDILSEPLIHMVRNAVDHGVESPEERAESGKDEVGTITLSASQQGGYVIVELSDDGKGLDRDRILQKAIKQGVVSPDRQLSDQEVMQLIFSAGLSTVDKVTDISGRGVGMDVVRQSIEALKGQITIKSEVGTGTRFIISLPLTLAITDGMVVRVGSERFIVPTLSISVIFQPSRNALTRIGQCGEVVRLRGQSLPLVRLHELFRIQGAQVDPAQALIVALDDGNDAYALLVDELLGKQQVVNKGLGDGIGHVPGVSGGAILADGRVGLILDPSGIVRHSIASASSGFGGLSGHC
ncbi:MAG: chemotaxis protein CheA [Sandaracinaceae bacterium]